MKFNNPKFEKVYFEDLDVVLGISLETTSGVIDGAQYGDEDFFEDED